MCDGQEVIETIILQNELTRKLRSSALSLTNGKEDERGEDARTSIRHCYSGTHEEAIRELLYCDTLDKHITKYNFQSILENKSDIPQYLTKIGDDIVHRLVRWTHQLPFYSQIDVKVHTQLLTSKWHEILLLSTLYSMCKSELTSAGQLTLPPSASFAKQLDRNMRKLQYYLSQVCWREVTLEELQEETGEMMEKVTLLIQTFARLQLHPEEFVCLKVLLLLSRGDLTHGSKLQSIQDRYLDCLQGFVEGGPFAAGLPSPATRFGELLLLLPQLQSAAELLLSSKMFYVPFLLNSLRLPGEEETTTTTTTIAGGVTRIPLDQKPDPRIRDSTPHHKSPSPASYPGDPASPGGVDDKRLAAPSLVAEDVDVAQPRDDDDADVDEDATLDLSVVKKDDDNGGVVKNHGNNNVDVSGDVEPSSKHLYSGGGAANENDDAVVKLPPLMASMAPPPPEVAPPSYNAGGFESNKLRQLLEAPKETLL